jgi:hypothetical protein
MEKSRIRDKHPGSATLPPIGPTTAKPSSLQLLLFLFQKYTIHIKVDRTTLYPNWSQLPMDTNRNRLRTFTNYFCFHGMYEVPQEITRYGLNEFREKAGLKNCVAWSSTAILSNLKVWSYGQALQNLLLFISVFQLTTVTSDTSVRISITRNFTNIEDTQIQSDPFKGDI